MTQRVVIMQGLPGSGKSTIARRLVTEEGFVRVGRDDLRHMLADYHAFPKHEPLVTLIASAAIEGALRLGYSVVMDACHLTRAQVVQVTKIARRGNIEAEVLLVDTPLAECLRRNAAREGDDRVPDSVIRAMHKEWKATR
jgi:predicted kinase